MGILIMPANSNGATRGVAVCKKVKTGNTDRERANWTEGPF